MKRIFKYTLPTKFGAFVIDMPYGAEIKAVQVQNGIPCIWAFVNTEEKVKERVFVIVPTGNHVPVDVEDDYLGTFQIAGLVYHVFG